MLNPKDPAALAVHGVTGRFSPQAEVPDPNRPEAAFQFEGLHLLASYQGCQSSKVRDLAGLVEAMTRGATAAGATVLGENHHVFPNGGITILLLLAESHASLHTYPEYDSCFIDIFTCGTSCRLDEFEALMRQHLSPAEIHAQVLHRSYHTKEHSSFWQSGPASEPQ